MITVPPQYNRCRHCKETIFRVGLDQPWYHCITDEKFCRSFSVAEPEIHSTCDWSMFWFGIGLGFMISTLIVLLFNQLVK